MPAPINTFKTVSANVTTSTTSVYTAPSGYTTVALLAQASNITDTHTVGVTAYYVHNGVSTSIISNVQIQANDAVNLLTGKLILQTGDSISIKCNENTAAQLLLSVLETAN
jgi:hypothetical protein